MKNIKFIIYKYTIALMSFWLLCGFTPEKSTCHPSLFDGETVWDVKVCRSEAEIYSKLIDLASKGEHWAWIRKKVPEATDLQLDCFYSSWLAGAILQRSATGELFRSGKKSGKVEIVIPDSWSPQDGFSYIFEIRTDGDVIARWIPWKFAGILINPDDNFEQFKNVCEKDILEFKSAQIAVYKYHRSNSEEEWSIDVDEAIEESSLIILIPVGVGVGVENSVREKKQEK